MIRDNHMIGVRARECLDQSQKSKSHRALVGPEFGSIKLWNDIVDIEYNARSHQPWDDRREDLKVRYRMHVDYVVTRFHLSLRQEPHRSAKEGQYLGQVADRVSLITYTRLDPIDFHAINRFFYCLSFLAENNSIYLVSTLG
jgi:hypothetical protein